MKTNISLFILFLPLIICGCINREFKYSNPEAFFEENKIIEPTAIISIGMSGSGKSTWSEVGEQYGWKIVDSDRLNYEILKQMRMNQQIAPELSAVPDETNSYHLYALRNKGISQSKIELDGYILGKQSFIFDSLGLNNDRNKLTAKLRENGYKIWYLVFKSDDISYNRNNLFIRESKGGFASFKELPVKERCTALNRMLNQQMHELTKVVENFKPDKLMPDEKWFFVQVKDLRDSGIILDPCL